jgi:glyoxylase-like metal-dependent hydrolase (beta-lactamase superfamily II)
MEILPGVHRIASVASTAYLLVDDRDGLTIIDTGPTRFDRVILRYLQRIGRRSDEVRRIILTHRHFDHMGGAAALREATRAQVWAHAIDKPQIDGTEPNRMPKGALGAVMGVVVPFVFPVHPCRVDQTLSDGQIFDLGGLGPLQVLLTPGHTMGHCSLLLPARRLFILGDALNNFSGTPATSFDAVNDDTPLAHRTTINMADVEADALVFGHGNPILQHGQAALRAAAEKARTALARIERP